MGAGPVYNKVAWPFILGIAFVVLVQIAKQRFAIDLGDAMPYVQQLFTAGVGYSVVEAVRS